MNLREIWKLSQNELGNILGIDMNKKFCMYEIFKV